MIEFVILFDAKKVQHTCHHISNQSVAGVHCRSLMFEKPVRGYALQQHVFKQIYLSMGIKPDSDYKNRCLMENTCVRERWPTQQEWIQGPSTE